MTTEKVWNIQNSGVVDSITAYFEKRDSFQQIRQKALGITQSDSLSQLWHFYKTSSDKLFPTRSVYLGMSESKVAEIKNSLKTGIKTLPSAFHAPTKSICFEN